MQDESTPAGWRVKEWVKVVRISPAGFYLLPPEYRPRAVLIGKRRIILEAPAEWLTRMEKAGGVPILQHKTASTVVAA
ncbi:MAG: hypothetical protein WA373_01965 [Burkholderiales bacterium]